MENNTNNAFANELAKEELKPQFLKILCILSFIWCGIMIIIYLIGSFCLAMSEETTARMMEIVMETNPTIEIDNPTDFLHQIGRVSLMCMFTNIISLVGVIMMWNLNKAGFFIYAAAEIATNFIGLNFSMNGETQKSYGMMIFIIIIDLVFIGMYAIHLKYMNRPNRSLH